MLEWSRRRSTAAVVGDHVPRWYTADVPNSTRLEATKTALAQRSPAGVRAIRTMPAMSAMGVVATWIQPRSLGLTFATTRPAAPSSRSKAWSTVSCAFPTASRALSTTSRACCCPLLDLRLCPECVTALSFVRHTCRAAPNGANLRLRNLRNRKPSAPHPARPGAVTPATAHGTCLLYTSDAADDRLCVDLGG